VQRNKNDKFLTYFLKSVSCCNTDLYKKQFSGNWSWSFRKKKLHF